jgi:hypothetical protein
MCEMTSSRLALVKCRGNKTARVSFLIQWQASVHEPNVIYPTSFDPELSMPGTFLSSRGGSFRKRTWGAF